MLDRSAPLALRERLAFGAAELVPALVAARRVGGLPRLTILSTCHRVELHSEADGAGGRAVTDRLVDWLVEYRGVPRAEIVTSARFLQGEPAARHLYRVAAGLDAALLGEAEVLAQVRGAFRASLAAHSVAPILKTTLRDAVLTAERARALVWRHFRRADIGTITADVLEEQAESLDGVRVLVVGAGHAGHLAVRALCARAATVEIVNRTPARARDLAARHDTEWRPFDELGPALDQAGCVVVATAAPAAVLTVAAVSQSLARRPRVLSVVDTAMPHNVDPAITGLSGVHLTDLHELSVRLARAHGERVAAVPAVEQLIEERLAAMGNRQGASDRARSSPQRARAASGS